MYFQTKWNISAGYTGGRSDNNCPDLHSAFWIFTTLLSYKINWYKAKTLENAHMEECEPVGPCLDMKLRKPAQPLAVKPSTQTLVDEAPPHPSPSTGQWVLPHGRKWSRTEMLWLIRVIINVLPMCPFSASLFYVSSGFQCIPLAVGRGPCQLLGWFVSRVFYSFLNFSALHES